jgi:hypothetical protein
VTIASLIESVQVPILTVAQIACSLWRGDGLIPPPEKSQREIEAGWNESLDEQLKAGEAKP